jgi:hypothetical protein
MMGSERPSAKHTEAPMMARLRRNLLPPSFIARHASRLMPA